MEGDIVRYIFFISLFLISGTAFSDTLEPIGQHFQCSTFKDLSQKGYVFSQPKSHLDGDTITFEFSYNFYVCQRQSGKMGFSTDFSSLKESALIVQSPHISFWDIQDYPMPYRFPGLGTIKVRLKLSQLFSPNQINKLHSTGALTTYLYVVNGLRFIKSWGKYQLSDGAYLLRLRFTQNRLEETFVEVLSFERKH